MKYKLVQGRKAKEDKIIFISTDSWEAISFKQILFLLNKFFDNEDICYPKGKGRHYLKEAINDLANKVPFEEVLVKYKLKGR